MRGIQISLILFILCSPSFLLQMDRTEILYLIPQSAMEVGELIYAHLPEKNELRLGTKTFEKIPHTPMGFAVLGLSASLTESIQEFSTQTQYDGLQPYRTWLSQRLLVRRTPLEQANTLRLPANVWQKVNNEEQSRKDRALMTRILSEYDTSEDIFTCMHRPLHTIRVSKFASPRYLPNGKAYYHSGVDLRAFVPTPLASMGKGKVVFADFMMTPGNMVVISHGKGLFSRYMHMSQLNVKAGDLVTPGQIIGLTGNTGRVEAPHLHWEIIWKGNHADPENFLLQWERICGRS